jgi:hypothetical protein
MVDVVQLVKDGKAKFDWTEIRSVHEDKTLIIDIMRDAMKFDNIPAMTWNLKPVYVYKNGVKTKDERTFDGVRLPASAYQLQEIAWIIGGMMMTPKVVDLKYLAAGENGLQFNPVANLKGSIVATSNIHDVHEAIEARIESKGGYPAGGVIDVVGKYWVLVNELLHGQKFGNRTACNYGWTDQSAPAHRKGVLGKTKVWQRMGFAHDDAHFDPSQVIRLMYRFATLIRGDGEPERVDLHQVAQDPELAPLISHQGPLKYLHQARVPEPEATTAEDGTIILPEVTIYGAPPK